MDCRYPQTMLATCCVPWRMDQEIDEAVFRESIRILAKGGFHDLYVFGTAGEGYAVGERQFEDVVRIFDEEARRHSIDPMVGIISLSLVTIIERIERCLERGIRLFQISLPCWGALSDTEVAIFFDETCGRFPEARFLHYNLPRAKRLITAEEYGVLADRHPNLVATKSGAADAKTLEALFEHAGVLRHFVTEPGFSPGILLGNCGFLVSIASINPTRARIYFEAGLQRDVKLLEVMAGELAEMLRSLVEAVGSEVHIDGAFDKVFNKLHDPRFPLRLLPPYVSMSDEAFTRYQTFLEQRFPQWYPSLGDA